MYFGVDFLNEVGFLSKDPRMLPGADFSQVDAIRAKITAHIETLRPATGALNPYLQNALNLVQNPKPTATDPSTD